MITDSRVILFFDGYCALCHWCVRFVLKRYQSHQIYVAPLDGKTAQVYSIERGSNTLVFKDSSGSLYRYSDAVIHVLHEIGGGWRFLALIQLIPKFIRNGIYRGVSWSRYSIFGRYDQCPILPSEYRDRLLP